MSILRDPEVAGRIGYRARQVVGTLPERIRHRVGVHAIGEGITAMAVTAVHPASIAVWTTDRPAEQALEG